MMSGRRPLSPHLQIYRLPLTVLLSILHRITGVFLGLGILLLVYCLLALANGPQTYAGALALVTSWPGQVILFLWTFALYFHFCNGIRHLFWDAGIGFELRTLEKSTLAVIIASGTLTVLTWGLAMLTRGG